MNVQQPCNMVCKSLYYQLVISAGRSVEPSSIITTWSSKKVVVDVVTDCAMKAGQGWPWDDGNELPRVIRSGSRVPVHFRFFADFRTVYRDYFGSCSLTHFRRASMRTTFLGFGVLRVLYINVSKFPRHVTAVVKVIECIFERPLHHSRAEGRQFEIVRSPPRFPLSQPRIRLTPATKR